MTTPVGERNKTVMQLGMSLEIKNVGDLESCIISYRKQQQFQPRLPFFNCNVHLLERPSISEYAVERFCDFY